jgi:anti-sigma factor RsiW
MHDFGDFEVHLATCPECSQELARYREVMAAVGSLQGVLETPPIGFTERVVAQVTRPVWLWRSRVTRLARDRRVHVAAASVGGALVGATAIGLVWWRLGKRAVSGLGTGLPA